MLKFQYPTEPEILNNQLQLQLIFRVYFIIFPSWLTNNDNNLFITHFTKQMLNGVNTKEKQQKKKNKQ